MNRERFCIPSAAATIAWSSPLHAQAGTAAGAPSVWTTLLALAAVIATILVTGWLLRKLAPGQTLRNGDLRLAGQISLGARERVVLVDAGTQRFVLGVTASRIDLLGVQALPTSADAAPAPTTDPIGRWLDAVRRPSRADTAAPADRT